VADIFRVIAWAEFPMSGSPKEMHMTSPIAMINRNTFMIFPPTCCGQKLLESNPV